MPVAPFRVVPAFRARRTAGLGDHEVWLSTPMDREAADRIGDAAARDPESSTAVSGFDERAADAAERNEPDPYDEDDWDGEY